MPVLLIVPISIHARSNLSWLMMRYSFRACSFLFSYSSLSNYVIYSSLSSLPTQHNPFERSHRHSFIAYSSPLSATLTRLTSVPSRLAQCFPIAHLINPICISGILVTDDFYSRALLPIFESASGLVPYTESARGIGQTSY